VKEVIQYGGPEEGCSPHRFYCPPRRFYCPCCFYSPLHLHGISISLHQMAGWQESVETLNWILAKSLL